MAFKHTKCSICYSSGTNDLSVTNMDVEKNLIICTVYTQEINS